MHSSDSTTVVGKEKSTEPLLSLCILTYNRPAQLKRALDSIIAQITPEVEVVICDNSTSLETEGIIREYIHHTFIHYYKNGQNIGFDRNVLRAVERSRGCYLWFFGDDDELMPGAIAHTLRILKGSPSISYVWVNGYRGWIGRHKPFSKRTVDMFYDDRNEVIEDLGGLIGFISATIVKREKLLELDVEKYVGTGWVLLHGVLHVLSQEGLFYYIGYPYVSQYYTPGTKVDVLQMLLIDFSQAVCQWRCHFNKRSIRKMFDKNFGQLWRQLYAENVKDPKVLSGRRQIIIEMNKHSLKFWLVILPWLMVPRPFNRFLYQLLGLVHFRPELS